MGFEQALHFGDEVGGHADLATIGDTFDTCCAIDHRTEVVHALGDWVDFAHGLTPVNSHADAETAEDDVAIGVLDLVTVNRGEDLLRPLDFEKLRLDGETPQQSAGDSREGDHESVTFGLDFVATNDT